MGTLQNINSTELSEAEQYLIWDQGGVDDSHPDADKLLSIASALKLSGFKLPAILSVFRGIFATAVYPKDSVPELPPFVTIMNNRYAMVPIFESECGLAGESNVFDINTLSNKPLSTRPDEPRLMALTFWI